jgi:hypothetical protein
MKLLVLIITLTLVGCSRPDKMNLLNNNQNQFKVISFIQRSGGQFICNDTVLRQDIKNDSCLTFYYKSKDINHDFKISVFKKDTLKGILKYQDDSNLYHYDFVESKLFYVNDRCYNIIKLSYSDAPTDGEHDIYINEDFGLIGLQSRAWNSWMEYKCLNDSINQIITCLQIQLYKDFQFYWDLEMDKNGTFKRIQPNYLTEKEFQDLLKDELLY